MVRNPYLICVAFALTLPAPVLAQVDCSSYSEWYSDSGEDDTEFADCAFGQSKSEVSVERERQERQVNKRVLTLLTDGEGLKPGLPVDPTSAAVETDLETQAILAHEVADRDLPAIGTRFRQWSNETALVAAAMLLFAALIVAHKARKSGRNRHGVASPIAVNQSEN